MKSKFIPELSREDVEKSFKEGVENIKSGKYSESCYQNQPFRRSNQCLGDQYALFVFEHPEWFIDEIEDEFESFYDVITRVCTKYFKAKGLCPLV